MILTRVEQKRQSKLSLKPRALSPFSYGLKYAPDIQALDNISEKPVIFDQNQMSATGVLASTYRDREGDILEVSGIDTTHHRINPIVLLDHASYYGLPIGKTEDPTGNYTVTIHPELGECLQTTFFSQHSDVAEQVYNLYCEGILRACSIGYRSLKMQPIAADPIRGHKQGKHIISCELIEATWCGIPMNPDCVMATLSKDKICGKVIAPAVKSLLLPYAIPKKVYSYFSNNFIQSATKDNGNERSNKMAKHSNIKGKAEPMSSLDESRGGALRGSGRKKKSEISNEEDKLDAKGRKFETIDYTPASDSPDENGNYDDPEDQMGENESDEPLGAETLRDLYADLNHVLDQYSQAFKKVENPPVNKKTAKLLDDLETAAEDISSLFDECYPDLEPLSPSIEDVNQEAESEEDPSQEDESKDVKNEDGGDDEDGDLDAEDEGREKSKSSKASKSYGKLSPKVKGKRFTKSQSNDMSDLKALIEEMMSMENMDAKTKSALKFHLRSLSDMLQKGMGPKEEQDCMKSENLSPEDQKAIQNLERQINRRERLLNKIGF